MVVCLLDRFVVLAAISALPVKHVQIQDVAQQVQLNVVQVVCQQELFAVMQQVTIVLQEFVRVQDVLFLTSNRYFTEW